MIISASRRTDIPAFYAEWFINRIRAGYCLVPNPYNRLQVSLVSLRPEDVEAIVFWTRDPRPLMPYLAELDRWGYRYYFQFTLTGYPAILEPRLPERATLIRAFRDLAKLIGSQKVIWRYDPIILSTVTDPSFHAQNFASLAEALAGMTKRVVISFFDPYIRATRRLRQLAASGVMFRSLEEVDQDVAELLRSMASLAQERGMEIRSCAEAWDLQPYGILPGKCVDDKLITRLFGIEVTHEKDSYQRATCRCVRSKDIGVYDSCLHGCVYCYASDGGVAISAGKAWHDPQSPSLLTWASSN